MNIALMESMNIRTLPVDHKGLIISDEIKDCDCIYTTPSHHFPTTVTMPLERRQALLELTRQSNTFIIEDDYEAEISFNDTPPPALKSLDNWGM
nr:hypothetical protein [Aliamphritea spongicola]